MRPPVASLLLLIGLAAPAAAAPPPQIPVSGRIVDAEGRGVAGVAVRLLETRREFQVLKWEFDDQVKAAEIARTDEAGFFEATLRPDPSFRYFWLRFYDPATFDGVRYELPEDRDVTSEVREGRRVIATVILADHPAWPRVRAWIEDLGPDSPRGQLVRRMGFPDRHEVVDGVELFGYARADRVYRFVGEAFVGEGPWGTDAPAASSGGA